MADAESILKAIDLVEGILQVFEKLKAMGFDLIVLSGANDLLCRKYLEIHGVSHLFQDFIANPMTYNSDTDEFNYIIEPSFDCKTPLCGMRICKKSKLSAYLETHPQYQTIYFFGDGTNDLCGMSLIPKGKGKAFIRKYYGLHDMISGDKSLARNIEADVKYWVDGRDLIEKL
jgi:HAD superfamily phosphoserine phosphatase-like hydrolase